MSQPRPLNLTHLGWGLALPVLFLSTVGMLAIHATDRSGPSGEPAVHVGGEAPTVQNAWVRLVDAVGPQTARQGMFLVTGLAIFAVALVPSYQKLGRFAFAFYWLVVAMLALIMLDHFVDVPIVPVVRDTRRWIGVGEARVQPSEFMKLALVLALARYLRFRDSYRTWTGLVPPFLLTLLPMVLILEQPDLGTLLMLLPVLFTLLFVAGAKLSHLATIVLLGLATLPVFYFFGMKDYQRKRVEVVFRQDSDDPHWHMGPGYQLRQSKTALGLGGLTGEGYKEGVFVRYELLPEKHNDFIFAIVGNQWGLVGGVLVILAYAIIVLVGIEVATVTNDPFGRLLAVGVVAMIAFQAMLNICMTIGRAPITGMPLPFVSAGGSSLWTNFAALGLLVNVAQRRPMLIARPPFEYGKT